MKNFISFDLCSDFGFFRKPDVNKIGLTYNIPPKPSLLGLLGSILGMSGINKQYESLEDQGLEKNQETKHLFPEYYTKLKHLKIGIEPLEGFPFNKIINTYNSRNSYFGNDKYENVLIHEQLLIRPQYTIYVYDNSQDNIMAELTKRLKNNNPVFIPYLGKNEFIACIKNVKSVNAKSLKDTQNHISSIFLINKTKQQKETPSYWGPTTSSSVEMKLPESITFLEDYPIGYADDMHYELQTLRYSDKPPTSIDLDKGELFDIGNNKVIYLF